MEVSPYLSAIQSLEGETPGEKYKEFHSIAAKIIESNEEREKFVKTGESNLVLTALQPNLRILVGLKLKSKDAVIEALKSDNVTIIKIALGAQWFFDPSNDLINVRYFAEKLLPFVSLRTRLELIKVLSKCLQARQAESFHKEFVVQFGSDKALPLLAACGEDYIYDEVLKNKIHLPERMLKDLYRKYPQLVIRILRAIKNIGCYIDFLPYLVKNHTQEFIELSHGFSIKLGDTRAEYFLKNAVNVLVDNPNAYLGSLPLKVVRRKLSEQQYNTMLRNLFPGDVDKLTVSTIIYTFKHYYPKEGGFELYRENYQKTYGKDLLEHKDFFKDECIYEILPPDIAAQYPRKKVDYSKDIRRAHELPPSEAIPLMKEHIKKSAVLQRDACLTYMLRSCDLHKSKADLLEVLQYYNSRHKNEQAPVLLQWLNCLSGLFDHMKSLDNEHWQVIKDIVQRAYVKGHLFTPNWYFDSQRLFKPMLIHFLKQCRTDEAEEADKVFLDKMINILLECYCEHNDEWDFLTNVPEIEGACLEKFLLSVPQKYPETDPIWNKNNNKLNLTCYFLERIGEFNDRNLRIPSDPKAKATKMLIQDYPWLENFATELLTDDETRHHKRLYRAFVKALRTYWLDFYQKVIDEHPDMINDVSTNEALMVLRRDRSKILTKIDAYVTGCRKKLIKGGQHTRRFVMSLKWYRDIPLGFVDKCLAEIEEKGSILILGMLLEGQALSKIIEPYLPKASTLEIDDDDAKKNYELVSSLPRALNYTNPPPALEVLISLCRGDYLSVALQTLSSIAQRTPIDRVLSFANRLTNDVVSVRKAGIRLVFQVAAKPQVREFLSEICKEEKNPGIREVIAKMVHEVFTQTPSQDSWQLMQELIHGLLPDDKNIYDILKQFKRVHADYAADYVIEILKKINGFSVEELDEVNRWDRVRSFLYEIDNTRLFNEIPEDMMTEVITKHLFDCPLPFTFNMYLFSDDSKFESRLKLLMGILSESLTRMNEPHSENSRAYPTLKTIHNVLASGSIFDILQSNKNKEMSLRFISSVLERPEVVNDLECFINFNVYQIYMEASDAKVFGEKCGKNMDDLAKLYNSQLTIEYYNRFLQRIVKKSSFKNQLFDVVDGLMSYNRNYGAIVGFRLLSAWWAKNDERYDRFVHAARSSDDLIIRAMLNDFLREY